MTKEDIKPKIPVIPKVAKSDGVELPEKIVSDIEYYNQKNLELSNNFQQLDMQLLNVKMQVNQKKEEIIKKQREHLALSKVLIDKHLEEAKITIPKGHTTIYDAIAKKIRFVPAQPQMR